MRLQLAVGLLRQRDPTKQCPKQSTISPVFRSKVIGGPSSSRACSRTPEGCNPSHSTRSRVRAIHIGVFAQHLERSRADVPIAFVNDASLQLNVADRSNG